MLCPDLARHSSVSAIFERPLGSHIGAEQLRALGARIKAAREGCGVTTKNIARRGALRRGEWLRLEAGILLDPTVLVEALRTLGFPERLCVDLWGPSLRFNHGFFGEANMPHYMMVIREAGLLRDVDIHLNVTALNGSISNLRVPLRPSPYAKWWRVIFWKRKPRTDLLKRDLRA